MEVRDLQVIKGGRLILDLPSLAINRKETLTIIGPNGAGKSTLLKVLGLLERPSGGAVCFEGEEVSFRGSLLSHRRRIALVFQEALLRNASTFENVATGLRFRGVPHRETIRRAEEWMERLGISHVAKRNAKTLSGGEAQRTSLARALVLEPDLLLLDEPFAGLDEPSRDSLMNDLQQILDGITISTVFVTHQRSEALAFGDRVAVMMGGRVQQIGSPESVFSAPASEEVASFTGMENIVTGLVARSEDGLTTIDVHGKQVEVVGDYALGEELVVGVRPEEVVVESAPDQIVVTSARNRLYGRISRSTPLGSQFRIVIDCGFPLVALVTKRSFSEMGLGGDVRVLASFKASAIHVIRRRRVPSLPE